MSRWTKGPWFQGKDGNDQPCLYGPEPDEHWIALLPHQCIASFEERAEANAARIVQCVNALAGIPDPERAIAAAREALRMVVALSSDRTIIDECYTALALLEPKP